MEDKEFRRVILSAILGTIAGFITTQLCDRYIFSEACPCRCCTTGAKCLCNDSSSPTKSDNFRHQSSK